LLTFRFSDQKAVPTDMVQLADEPILWKISMIYEIIDCIHILDVEIS